MTIPWFQANDLADRIVQKLSPTCHQIMVCGSIRRHDTNVKDIDIVCLPIIDRVVLQRDLWEKPVTYQDNNLLLNLVNDTDKMWELGLTKVNGDKKKITIRFVVGNDVNIELYLVERINQFGFAVLVRTGPGNISKRIMQLALDRHWHIHQYELHQHEKGGRPGRRTVCPRGGGCTVLATTPTEQDAFNALGLAYPVPEARVPHIIEKLIDEAHERRYISTRVLMAGDR